MARPKAHWIPHQPGEVPPPPAGDPPSHRKLIQRAEDRMRLVTISDQIAGETLHTRSFKWDIGNQHFPEDVDAHLRFVTKFYPYTRTEDGKPNGPSLYVDEPMNERQVREAYAKQKILHKKGLRHIVVEPHRTDPDTGAVHESSTLDDCLAQLDGMPKRGKA